MRPGTIAGTPAYMAPEQARGHRGDVRSDLFCLGSVLFLLCTGRPPFTGSRPLQVLDRVRRARPRPIPSLNPEIPTWLVEIIVRLHALRPADRFTSAAEVAELLRHYLAHLRCPTWSRCRQRLQRPGKARFSLRGGIGLSADRPERRGPPGQRCPPLQTRRARRGCRRAAAAAAFNWGTILFGLIAKYELHFSRAPRPSVTHPPVFERGASRAGLFPYPRPGCSCPLPHPGRPGCDGPCLCCIDAARELAEWFAGPGRQRPAARRHQRPDRVPVPGRLPRSARGAGAAVRRPRAVRGTVDGRAGRARLSAGCARRATHASFGRGSGPSCSAAECRWRLATRRHGSSAPRVSGNGFAGGRGSMSTWTRRTAASPNRDSTTAAGYCSASA